MIYHLRFVCSLAFCVLKVQVPLTKQQERVILHPARYLKILEFFMTACVSIRGVCTAVTVPCYSVLDELCRILAI